MPPRHHLRGYQLISLSAVAADRLGDEVAVNPRRYALSHEQAH